MAFEWVNRVGEPRHPYWSDLDNTKCYECGAEWDIVDCDKGHERCISVECVKCGTWESTCYEGED